MFRLWHCGKKAWTVLMWSWCRPHHTWQLTLPDVAVNPSRVWSSAHRRKCVDHHLSHVLNLCLHVLVFMLSKGPLVRVWRKQNCGARKPAQAPRKTRYARKQNVCARKQNASIGVRISLLDKDQFVSALALQVKGMRSSLSTPNLTIEGISRQLRARSTRNWGHMLDVNDDVGLVGQA